MKTFINIKSTNNKNTFGNSAKNMNLDFIEKILDFAPYFKPETTKSITIAGTFKPKKKPTTKKSGITYNGIDIYDFASACKFLDTYKKDLFAFDTKDEYDFELADGTPVRIFDDEIQIGYDLYDLPFGKSFFDLNIPEKKKKTIIDIAIKLKK